MRSVRIAVAGSEGQVARAMTALWPMMDVVVVGGPELDLKHPTSVSSTLVAAITDAIVSASSYTVVDNEESERELAFVFNGAGAAAVAEAVHRLRVPMLHLSTDYVLDGTKPDAYIETDPTRPTSAYVAAKLEREKRVAAATDITRFLARHGSVRYIDRTWSRRCCGSAKRTRRFRSPTNVASRDRRGRIAHAIILAAQRMIEDG